eukprot:1611556-Pyramimonas_sp.AAC.1
MAPPPGMPKHHHHINCHTKSEPSPGRPACTVTVSEKTSTCIPRDTRQPPNGSRCQRPRDGGALGSPKPSKAK